MKFRKPLSDDEIGALIDAKVAESVKWYGSKLSLERERVIRYYNSEYPKRTSAGSSSYISSEVYDAVEAMKAQLLETFAGGQDLVHFDATNPQDVEPARIATAYTKYVIFGENDGYRVLSDTIHDGLTARVGIAKVFWEESYDLVEEEFDGLDEASVQGMAAQEDITQLDAEMDETTGAFSGKLTRRVDTSGVRIITVNPEEFSVEPQAKELSKDYFHVHRSVKTVEQLEAEGYDTSKIDVANMEEDLDLNMAPEVLARFQQTDSGFKTRIEDQADGTRHLLISECYMTLRRKGNSRARFYKVVRCGKVTIEIEEVDDSPFVPFIPLPIPHSFMGNNFAERVIPAQNVRTQLVRSVIDHANITNNPRLQVLKGGLTNPRELLDNRLGGIVNVTRPDAIVPLQQANLNPYVYQTLDLIKQNLEETTGISSLSQGLNKDAVSNQNSQGMINDLVNLSQTRQKIIARNFAQFLTKLYLKVYDLVLANEKRKNIVELAGNWVEVDVSQWHTRKTCSMSLHLGYGELDREADKRTQMFALWTQDPQISQMFGMQQRYKAATDVAKMRGIMNVNDYLMPPQQVQPQQPDPMKVAEMQANKTKADAALMTAQANQRKIDAHMAIEKMKAALNQSQQTFDNHIKAQDAHRKDVDVASRVDIGQREIALAEQSPSGDNIVVSPR